jgi:hypothetical protein
VQGLRVNIDHTIIGLTMRTHYTPARQPRPIADAALAIAIGLALALVLFFNL